MLSFEHVTPLEEDKRPSVADLQARKLPHCCARDIASPTSEKGEGIMVALDAYLVKFLAPSKTCIRCASTLGGVLGSFDWGLAHGLGSCTTCGWPIRVYHHIPFEGDNLKLTMMLMYHPDEVLEDNEQPTGGEQDVGSDHRT